MQPMTRRYEGAMQKVLTKTLKYVQKFQSVETTIKIAGSSAKHKIVCFSNADLKGHFSIYVIRDSLLPLSQTARISIAMDMFKGGAYGMLGTPEALDKLWDHIGDNPYLEPFEEVDQAKDCAEKENAELDMGKLPKPAAQWEPHPIHIKVHLRYMNQPDFKEKDPQIIQNAQFHLRTHEMVMSGMVSPAITQMLAAKQQADQGMTEGSPDELQVPQGAGGGAPPGGAPEPPPQGMGDEATGNMAVGMGG
jgi:hypothetical protein